MTKVKRHSGLIGLILLMVAACKPQSQREGETSGTLLEVSGDVSIDPKKSLILSIENFDASRWRFDKSIEGLTNSYQNILASKTKVDLSPTESLIFHIVGKMRSVASRRSSWKSIGCSTSGPATCTCNEANNKVLKKFGFETSCDSNDQFAEELKTSHLSKEGFEIRRNLNIIQKLHENRSFCKLEDLGLSTMTPQYNAPMDTTTRTEALPEETRGTTSRKAVLINDLLKNLQNKQARLKNWKQLTCNANSTCSCTVTMDKAFLNKDNYGFLCANGSLPERPKQLREAQLNSQIAWYTQLAQWIHKHYSCKT